MAAVHHRQRPAPLHTIAHTSSANHHPNRASVHQPPPKPLPAQCCPASICWPPSIGCTVNAPLSSLVLCWPPIGCGMCRHFCRAYSPVCPLCRCSVGWPKPLRTQSMHGCRHYGAMPTAVRTLPSRPNVANSLCPITVACQSAKYRRPKSTNN